MQNQHQAQSIVTHNGFKLMIRFTNGQTRWIDLKKWLLVVTKANNQAHMRHFKVENGDLVFRMRRITGPTLYHMGAPLYERERVPNV